MSALSRSILAGFLFFALAISAGCANSESPISCETRSDCASDEVCLAGVCEPIATSPCTKDTECPTNFSCLDTQCVRDVEDDENQNQENQNQPNQNQNGDQNQITPTNQNNNQPQLPNQSEENQDIDPNSPRVVSVTPAHGTAGVNVDVQVRIKFDRPISPPSSSGTFLRTPEGEKVPATIEYLDNDWEVVLRPDSPLWQGTSYTINITESVLNKDQTHALMQRVKTEFTTEFIMDPTLEALAQAHAPIIYQEVRELNSKIDYNTDIPTFIDFDGDLKADNNKTNARRSNTKLPANVYYSAVATETHYFIHYILYYPTARHTGGGQGTTYFEHDFSGYVTVINRTTKDVELVEGVYVRRDFKDTKNLPYLPSNSPVTVRNPAHEALDFNSNLLVDGGRFPLYVQSGEHPACFWHDRPTRTFFSSVCQLGTAETFIGGEGIVLRPGTQAQTIDDAVQGDSGYLEMTYSLTPFIEPFWTKRNDFDCGLFIAPGFQYSPFAPAGHTPITGPDGAQLYLPTRLCSDDDGSYGLMPFRWFGADSSGGEWFLDPAVALSSRFNFGSNYSLNYCHNFYFGLDAMASAACQVD